MKTSFHITIFGANRESIDREILSQATSTSFVNYEDDAFMEPLNPVPDVVVCFAHQDGPSILEIAQTVRMNFPKGIIFFVTYQKGDFDKKKLMKNGFSQAYLLPWEIKDLLSSMQNEVIFSCLPELRNYTPVKIVDFQPGDILDFPVKAFLPLNNKLIPFASEGVALTEEKLQKLKEHSLHTLFIANEDIDKFRKYTAETLKKLLKPGALSETDRDSKLKSCVRDLISDIFIEDNQENTFGKSQALLKEVKAIINLLIDEKSNDQLKKLNSLIKQESSFYQHLSNVSAFAGVFSLMLGYENPDQMALAGILHDVGKVNLPPEYASLTQVEMSPNALKAYQGHAAYSIDVVRLKRIPLPDKVISGILQHHEAMNGTGYPEGLQGNRICIEGRILAIADEFDNLTALKPGEKVYTPKEALEKMLKDNLVDPGRMILDVDILRKLVDFISNTGVHG